MFFFRPFEQLTIGRVRHQDVLAVRSPGEEPATAPAPVQAVRTLRKGRRRDAGARSGHPTGAGHGHGLRRRGEPFLTAWPPSRIREFPSNAGAQPALPRADQVRLGPDRVEHSARPGPRTAALQRLQRALRSETGHQMGGHARHHPGCRKNLPP